MATMISPRTLEAFHASGQDFQRTWDKGNQSPTDALSKELEVLEHYFSGQVAVQDTARRLMNAKADNDQAPDMQDKDRRVTELLYDTVMEFADLHEPIFDLLQTIDRLLGSQDKDMPETYVSDGFDDKVSEFYAMARREDPEEDTLWVDQWEMLGAYKALCAAKMKDLTGLADGLSAIINTFEVELRFSQDESSVPSTGLNRQLPAASWVLIRAGSLIFNNIGNNTSRPFQVEFEPTKYWPHRTRITHERWSCWKSRLQSILSDSLPHLQEQQRTLAHKALDQMDAIEKDPQPSVWKV